MEAQLKHNIGDIIAVTVRIADIYEDGGYVCVNLGETDINETDPMVFYEEDIVKKGEMLYEETKN